VARTFAQIVGGVCRPPGHLAGNRLELGQWPSGGPEGYLVVTAIARKYPEGYRILGLPLPYGDEVQQLAEAWSGLSSEERLEILRTAYVAKTGQGDNQEVAVFGDWIYQKFYEWRGQSRSNKYVSQFAEYLGLPQATISHWINGTRAKTTDYRTIVTLARRYPEIYRALGLPLPYGDEVQQIAEAWIGLADEKRSRILNISGSSSAAPMGKIPADIIFQK